MSGDEDLLERSYSRTLTMADFGGVDELILRISGLTGHPLLVAVGEVVANHYATSSAPIPEALAMSLHEAISNTANPAIYRDIVDNILLTPKLLDALGRDLAESSLKQGTHLVSQATPVHVLRAADALELAVQLRLRNYADRWDLFACLAAFEPNGYLASNASYARAMVSAVVSCVEQWPGTDDLASVVRRIAGLETSPFHAVESGDLAPPIQNRLESSVLGDTNFGLALARIETVLALRANDRTQSIRHLKNAVRFLAPALAEDSSRADVSVAADIGNLLIDLLMTGTIRDPSLFARLRDNIRDLLHLDPGRSHWVRDRIAASHTAWAHLARQLSEAKTNFSQQSWYNAPAIVGNIVNFYGTAASTRAFVRNADGEALFAIIAPSLEHGFASKVSLLCHLQDHVAWVESQSANGLAGQEQLNDLEIARRILNASSRIFRLSEDNPPQPGEAAPRSEELEIAKLLERSPRIAHAVERRHQQAIFSLGSLIADDLLERVRSGFMASPDYAGEVEEAANLVAGLLIRFIWDRNQLGESEAPYLYSESANENDLADDLHGFLRGSGALGSIKTEVRRVAGGRVDIQFGFPGFDLYVELKVDSTRAPVPQKDAYIRQAASYTVVDKRLGFLVVLKLLPARKMLPPHLSDCLEVVEIHDSNDGPRHIVALTLSGARTKPSSM